MKRIFLLLVGAPLFVLFHTACESAGTDTGDADGGTAKVGDDDAVGEGSGENPLPDDPKVEKAFTGSFGFLDGPTWLGDALVFTDVTSQTEGKYAAFSWKPGADAPEIYGALAAQTIGLANGADGDLLGAEASGRIVKIGKDDSTAVVSTVDGDAINGPNDLVVRKSDGTIFFTEPGYLGANPDAEKNRVSRAPKGQTDGAAVDAVGATRPNGIALSPDGNVLYVSFTGAQPPVIQKYVVKEDGSTEEAKLFVELEAGSEPDGLAVDSAGNVYVATKGGGGGLVVVYSPKGTKHGEIAVPDQATGLAFGGADKKTLFITANAGSSGSVYQVTVNVAGVVD